MELLEKSRIEYCQSRDPTIALPVFSQTMQRGRFILMLMSWHCCNNEELPESDWLQAA